MLLNILCPKFGSKVETDDAHTYREGMKRLMVHIMKLSGECMEGTQVSLLKHHGFLLGLEGELG
jgi:hypothetical protein